jgi:hemolysin activation/secretion protein
MHPTRQRWLLRGGLELARWSQEPGSGGSPSVERVYTPGTLPGLGADPTYVHSQGTVGFDWRTSPGYTRRGGFYGVTVHDYRDRDQTYGFQQLDYEAIQHFPILREAWVISLHGVAQTAFDSDGQQIPFFMYPHLGGGSTLRGFTSFRFRDRHSMLLQAEWRIMANRFLDTAVFYDAGKVTNSKADLDFNHLKTDYGIGVRFHGPYTTAFRADVARGSEGTVVVFAGGPSF